MRYLLLIGLLSCRIFLNPAIAEEASAEQVKEWIHDLKTEPADSRYRLISQICKMAAPHAAHPPTESSNRVDLLPVLEAAIDGDDPKVSYQAICTLCYMNCKDAFPILERELRSERQVQRQMACMGIEWLAAMPEVRARAIADLEAARDRAGEGLGVRLAATSALLGAGVPQEPKVFLEALRDPRGNEAQAAKHLADMGRKDTIELMIVRLRTAVPSSDYWLAKSLNQLTGADLGKDAKEWQEWLDAHRAELPEQLN